MILSLCAVCYESHQNYNGLHVYIYIYIYICMHIYAYIYTYNDVRYVKSNNKIYTYIYFNHGKVLIIQVFYDYAGNSDDSKAVKPALPKN